MDLIQPRFVIKRICGNGLVTLETMPRSPQLTPLKNAKLRHRASSPTPLRVMTSSEQQNMTLEDWRGFAPSKVIKRTPRKERGEKK